MGEWHPLNTFLNNQSDCSHVWEIFLQPTEGETIVKQTNALLWNSKTLLFQTKDLANQLRPASKDLNQPTKAI